MERDTKLNFEHGSKGTITTKTGRQITGFIYPHVIDGYVDVLRTGVGDGEVESVIVDSRDGKNFDYFKSVTIGIEDVDFIGKVL